LWTGQRLAVGILRGQPAELGRRGSIVDMRVLQLYNNYVSGGGGETTMVRTTHTALEQHGHTVETVTRDNNSIAGGLAKAKVFLTGIYSSEARRATEELYDSFRPDVVHMFNLYPLFSPSVIVGAKQRGIPVVMGVQNYQLSCPTASHFSHGEECTRCIGGKEYNCALRNCKDNVAQSVGYAMRSGFAQNAGWYADGVNEFLAVSNIVRDRMVLNGYDPAKIHVVPNCVPLRGAPGDQSGNGYIGFVGRVTPEKGLHVLLQAARISGLPVRIAGDGPEMASLRAAAPSNVEFTGMLDRSLVSKFYAEARIIVVPSIWDEPFGLVAPEAMSYGLPVIAARSGGLQDIVLDGVTGRLYQRHDAEELARHMLEIWNSPTTALSMGKAGHDRASREYSVEPYYERLMDIYARAIARAS
jgi:glycosyltransferase involved in cell wall biosynthesis